MTVANDVIFLSLRNAGVTGVGQTPLAEDVNDALTVLNALIGHLNIERGVKANRDLLPIFPDLTTDVTFWSPYTHVLLTSLSVRLRQIYSLPPLELDVKVAMAALEAFNAINLQQTAPILAGVPNTARQAAILALRMAGRITDTQSVADGSADLNDAFSLLVMMLAQWQRRRWLVWNEEEAFAASTGAQFYTIGPGQDFDTARPDRVHAAWCRLPPFGGPNPVDIPLAIIESKEEWATLSIKDLRSMPSAVFYDSAFPTGRLYFWPVPVAAQYQLHILVKATLPVPATIDDPLLLPPEYLDAVVSNLACRMVVASGQQLSPFLQGQARAALNTIRLANTQIPLLSMPGGLGRGSGDHSSWAGRGLNHAWIVGGDCVLV